MTYKRRKHDAYFTEAHAVKTLASHIDLPIAVWDPAAGNGGIVHPLRRLGVFYTFRSDIKKYPGCKLDWQVDFTTMQCPRFNAPPIGIVSNPPYSHPLCERFIERALSFLEQPTHIVMVAMLLRSEYSHAPTFSYLFRKNYAARLDLTERIRWIAGTTERPRHNHSWFIWRRDHKGPAEHIIQRRAA